MEGTMIKRFKDDNIRYDFINGEVIFNAQDVCKSLCLKNTTEALRGLEKDDIISNEVVDKIGRNIKAYYVTEYGLYDLILKSRKKEARQFKKWITHEVLPSIRKTGKYSIPDEVKKISTKNRNTLTSEWKNHGINKPHQYIQLTLQEYKALRIDKKKKEMNKGELLLLSALESMESLKLFNDAEIDGYYECRDSMIETSSEIKNILPNKLKEVTSGK